MTSTVYKKKIAPIKELQQLLDPIVDEMWDVVETYDDLKVEGAVMAKNVEKALKTINRAIDLLMSIK